MKLKEKVLKYVRHKPFMRKCLSKVYLFFIKIRNAVKTKKFKEIYYISPKEVNNISGEYFNIFGAGVVKKGNRDIKVSKFSDYKIYKGLRERFVDGKERKETVYFKDHMKEIEDGRNLRNCTNEEEFLERCEGLDKLYRDIKENGYKLNKDSITGGHDEVTINVGRKGELLFNDGAHRLTIAKLLDLKEIPVRIVARHENRYNLIKYLRSVLPNGVSYQSLGHVDLDTNFIINHQCYDRFNLFKPFLPSPQKGSKALDIGGNIGFFTKELEKIGFDSYIIEHESFYIKVLEKVKGFLGLKYTIIDEDMFEWKGIKKHKFDVVLALNIFHHLVKTEDFYNKLVKFLNNLDMDVMIFEAHDPEEDQMEGAYKNYSPEEFVEFIMKETGLTKYEEIGMIEQDGRMVYKIYK